MTHGQNKLFDDVAQAIRDGINDAISSIVRPNPADAQALALHAETIRNRVQYKLKDRFRIGRVRRQQSELNP